MEAIAESTDVREDALRGMCSEHPLALLMFTQTPFGPFPEPGEYGFFRRYLDELATGEDIIIAKSRQMFGSWGACGVLLWRIMFTANYSALITSRMEKLVDDGGEHSTTESLMGRIRYLYDSLQPLVRALAPVRFTHLRAVCDTTGSFLVGQATTPNIGRGGTFDNVLCDEWAFVPQSEQSFSSVRPACRRGVWLLSTPNGPEGNFARIWNSPGSFRKVRIHWTEHPLRYDGLELDHVTGRPSSEWYRAMCAVMTQDQVARELDIDFSRSASGLVYPEFSYDRHYSAQVRYDPDLRLHMGMDFGIGAATAAVLFQVLGREMRVLADYEQENAPAEVNAANVWSVAQRLGFRGDKSELLCHGDPAGNAREIATGSTVIREYRTFGFTNFTTPRQKLRDGIRLVRRKLHQGEVYFALECGMVPRRIADYRYSTDDNGSVKGDDPIKNRATHLMDALRYGMTACFLLDGDATLHAPRERMAAEPSWQPRDRDIPHVRDGVDRPVMIFPDKF